MLIILVYMGQESTSSLTYESFGGGVSLFRSVMFIMEPLHIYIYIYVCGCLYRHTTSMASLADKSCLFGDVCSHEVE